MTSPSFWPYLNLYFMTLESVPGNISHNSGSIQLLHIIRLSWIFQWLHPEPPLGGPLSRRHLPNPVLPLAPFQSPRVIVNYITRVVTSILWIGFTLSTGTRNKRGHQILLGRHLMLLISRENLICISIFGTESIFIYLYRSVRERLSERGQ